MVLLLYSRFAWGPSTVLKKRERKEALIIVVYVDAGTPGRLNSVKFIMIDGRIHVYHGDDLTLPVGRGFMIMPRQQPSESRAAPW